MQIPNVILEESLPGWSETLLILSEDGATNWHLDISGSLAYYQVRLGMKTFYLVPPTAQNVALLEDWVAKGTGSWT